MHAVTIRNGVAEALPWLPEDVFSAYSEAKKALETLLQYSHE